MIKKNDVVQFNENHKWCGCLGIVNEVKPSRIMVDVEIPEKGTAFIFCNESDIEYIGEAVLVREGDE